MHLINVFLEVVYYHHKLMSQNKKNLNLDHQKILLYLYAHSKRIHSNFLAYYELKLILLLFF